jgi:hypothetical protein
MMMKKGGQGTAIEKELYLVDVPDVESLVPDVTAEMTTLYALWDAVCAMITRLIVVCIRNQECRGSRGDGRDHVTRRDTIERRVEQYFGNGCLAYGVEGLGIPQPQKQEPKEKNSKKSQRKKEKRISRC